MVLVGMALYHSVIMNLPVECFSLAVHVFVCYTTHAVFTYSLEYNFVYMTVYLNRFPKQYCKRLTAEQTANIAKIARNYKFASNQVWCDQSIAVGYIKCDRDTKWVKCFIANKIAVTAKFNLIYKIFQC